MKIKNLFAKNISVLLSLVSAVALIDNSWLFLGEATPPKDILEHNNKI